MGHAAAEAHVQLEQLQQAVGPGDGSHVGRGAAAFALAEHGEGLIGPAMA